MKRGEKLLKSKNSQVTIFVIIGLVIVLGIAMFLIFSSKQGEAPAVSAQKNPQGYIESCMEKQVESLIQELYDNGLTFNPQIRTGFIAKNASILCYNANFNELCTVSHPLLMREAERDMRNRFALSSNSCFEGLKQIYGPDYSEQGIPEVYLNITKDKVIATIKRDITVTRNDEARNFKIFSVDVRSGLYDFFIITNDIINGEVSCDCPNELCNANTLAIAQAHTGFGINKTIAGNDREAYTVIEQMTGRQSTFIVRNCVINFYV